MLIVKNSILVGPTAYPAVHKNTYVAYTTILAATTQAIHLQNGNILSWAHTHLFAGVFFPYLDVMNLLFIV